MDGVVTTWVALEALSKCQAAATSRRVGRTASWHLTRPFRLLLFCVLFANRVGSEVLASPGVSLHPRVVVCRSSALLGSLADRSAAWRGWLLAARFRSGDG